MMILDALRVSPELGVFLAVGMAYLLGSLKLGGFCLGIGTAALLAGLVVGNVWKEPSPDLRAGFFLLFLFANGYSVGPQFVSALKSGGSKPFLLSLVVCMTGLTVAVMSAWTLGLDIGLGAGLFSGAMTTSAAIGTATDAIKSIPLAPDVAARLISHVAVADALCYVFGAIGVIWFVGSLGPRILRLDLREAARRLEQELGIEEQPAGIFSAKRRFTARSFRLKPQSCLIGQRVADIETVEPEKTVFIARLRRGGIIIEALPDTTLQTGDIVVLYGHTAAVLAFGARHGEETVDDGLLDFPVEVLKVIIANKALCNRTAVELRHLPETRLIGVRSVRRGDQELPRGAKTTLELGDVVEVIGPLLAVERFARFAGHPLRPSSNSPLSLIGLGIVLGGCIGAPFLMIGTFKLTLGVTVGVLLSGVAMGLLASRRSTFTPLPAAAVELMKSLGQAVFLASVGMMAGPVFIDAAKALGLRVFAAGIVVTLIPQFVGLFFGRYVLHMNPVLLLGALAGAQTYTGALAALQERSGSSVAVLGYTVPYAVSNILLTTFGTVVVMLLSQINGP